MPIYEFRCQSCSVVSERLCASGVDVATVQCPACGGAVVRKFSWFRVGAGGGPVDGDETPRTQSSGGCSSCATQSCSTCSVL